jgi:predicted GNAT family acetyltransferase
VAEYRDEGHAVRFTHTQVQPRYEGQGLGSKLAAGALDDLRTQGRKALPQCPFIARYIAKHEKEYGDLVAR